MSKVIKMTRHELVWETREAEFDAAEWGRTLAWLKTFAEKETDPYTWEGRWASVYNRVKDMTFEDILADVEAYEKTDDYIVFTFKSKRYNSDEEWEYTESLYELIMEWLRDDCCDNEVTDWNYADSSEEYIEVVDLNN